GFPFTHQSLYEKGEEILKAKGAAQGTPFKPLGKQWSHNFLNRYRHRISTYWGTSLHQSQGRAVNAHTKKGWCMLLK
ncbi:hypothetical protein BS47DRAFT_1279165, partial [Hydnum rufescens UP504]